MERLLVLLCFVGLNTGLLAQEYAVDEGASFLAGMGSFSSQGGDLFAGFGDERATTVTLISSFNYFVVQNFFIGGGLDLSRQSQGNYTVTSWGIGPQIGYAIGNENSTAFPYMAAGVRYNSIAYGNANGNGTDVFFALGTVAALRSHAGLVFEGGYHIISLKTSNSGTPISGNIISLSIGIVGLLHWVTLRCQALLLASVPYVYWAMPISESNERLKINHVDVLHRMEHQITQWQSSGDRRHIFLSCYRLMTGNMLQAIEANPFQDGVWVDWAGLCSKLRSLMHTVSAYSGWNVLACGAFNKLSEN